MSEEIIPTRKGGRQPLGRGLGSLLGEARTSSAEQESTVRQAPPNIPKQYQPSAANAAPIGTASNLTPRETAAPKVEAPQIHPEQRIWKLAIEKVQPNKLQPRRTFAPEFLKELSDSIKEKGIIQPIIVRQIEGGQYEIVAGERRWRAAQLAGLREIPAILKTADAKETLELALIENIQRADLNPLEEAEAYSQLAKTYNLTQQEIATKMGKDRATVANLMRLLQLHPEVRQMVKNNELQLGQAKVLMSLEDMDDQLTVAKKIAKQGLTVRMAERLVKRVKSGQSDLSFFTEKEEITRKMLKEIENELQKKLGTKISIDQIGGKGKLSIQFYSFDELNQFIDRLRKM